LLTNRKLPMLRAPSQSSYNLLCSTQQETTCASVLLPSCCLATRPAPPRPQIRPPLPGVRHSEALSCRASILGEYLALGSAPISGYCVISFRSGISAGETELFSRGSAHSSGLHFFIQLRFPAFWGKGFICRILEGLDVKLSKQGHWEEVG
jgi:hypothetical protein